jgi:hypothetical protein
MIVGLVDIKQQRQGNALASCELTIIQDLICTSQVRTHLIKAILSTKLNQRRWLRLMLALMNMTHNQPDISRIGLEENAGADSYRSPCRVQKV